MDVPTVQNIEWIREFKIFTFREELPLFHITRKNLPMNTQDNENDYLKTLPPGTSIYDMTKPMYFSLDELHTIYYDTWDSSTNQWASSHLKGRTIRIIKLAYLGKRKYSIGNLNAFINFLMSNGIDGFIAYDDNGDRWREVYIFKPANSIIFTGELTHNNYDKRLFNENNMQIYPQAAADREQLSLDEHVISSQKLKDLSVRDDF